MKHLLNLGKTLNKAEQKNVFGGNPPPPPGLGNPCPCVSDYTVEPGGGDFCSYPAQGGPLGGGVCLGTIQNGMCCV